MKHILKMLLKIYDVFCVMMDFPYQLFVLVKRPPGQVRNDQINKPYFEATAIFLQQIVINRTDKPFILVQDVRLNKQLSIVAQTCIVKMPGIFTAMNITILCTNT